MGHNDNPWPSKMRDLANAVCKNLISFKTLLLHYNTLYIIIFKRLRVQFK